MNYYNDSKITYQQLVMEQIKIIQKIASKELRDGDKVLKNAMGEQIIEGDDTRYSFLQSVELLGSMLTPYFGNIMKDKSERCLFEQFCEYLDAELIQIMEDDGFKEEMKKIFGINDIKEITNDEKLRNQVNVFLLNDKIKEGRKIFRLLIKVFKSNNFLSEMSFGDDSNSSSNDAVEDDEEDLLEE